MAPRTDTETPVGTRRPVAADSPASDSASSALHESGSQDDPNVRLLLDRLTALLDDPEEYDSGCLEPTGGAMAAARSAVLEAANLVAPPFPRGSASADGAGAVRLTWDLNGRTVRLVCPGNHHHGSYLYHEEGDEYGHVAAPSSAVLADWLVWLARR